MPLNQRGRLKRTADEAINDLARAAAKLQSLADAYGEHHSAHRIYTLAVKELIEEAAKRLGVFLERFM